ncbi:hypothetical protein ACIA59_17380 [Micromonospora haikouensis]|uniref:hypothetical protein n=1 Tax=Micromonospora haikouensis TaxID=686309 RepID=UPI00379C91EB
MSAGIMQGIRAAAPEVGGLLLAVALVVVTVWVRKGIDAWRAARRRPVVRTVRRVFPGEEPLVPMTAAESSVPPLRRLDEDPDFPRVLDRALVGHDPTAAPRLPVLRPVRPAPPPRRWPPALGLTVSGVAIVALTVAALAAPGTPGAAGLAGLAVLILGWLGAVIVVAAVAERRAQSARYRGLHAASRVMYRRGQGPESLVISESLR